MKKGNYNYDVIIAGALRHEKDTVHLNQTKSFIQDIQTILPENYNDMYSFIITFSNGAKVKLSLEQIQEPDEEEYSYAKQMVSNMFNMDLQ